MGITRLLCKILLTLNILVKFITRAINIFPDVSGLSLHILWNNADSTWTSHFHWPFPWHVSVGSLILFVSWSVYCSRRKVEYGKKIVILVLTVALLSKNMSTNKYWPPSPFIWKNTDSLKLETIEIVKQVQYKALEPFGCNIINKYFVCINLKKIIIFILWNKNYQQTLRKPF